MDKLGEETIVSGGAPDLRVTLIAGTLAAGGSEKQLYHAARALKDCRVQVRVCTLTAGEHYESVLSRCDVPVDRVGQQQSRLARLYSIVRHTLQFQPHVIHSGHSYTNPYTVAAARAVRCIAIGSLRSSAAFCRASNGPITPMFFRGLDALVVNSMATHHELLNGSYARKTPVKYLPNCVDFPDEPVAHRDGPSLRVAVLGRLIAVKRVDRFLRALSLARRDEPRLNAIIAGDGPMRRELEEMAARDAVLADSVEFIGQYEDAQSVLLRASMLVHCSESEGSPNVVLEAMAAGLPVIATPAGDVTTLIHDGVNGRLVPSDSIEALAELLIALARSPELRRELGYAGRQIVQRDHSPAMLAARLLGIYAGAARERGLLCSRRTADTINASWGHVA
jgi:glycosyltransferase involved in cell wall biosynthesis